MAAKNMNAIVHKNICGGSKPKEPISLTHTSRHHSSISFSNAQSNRISSRPSQEKNARETHSKYIKTESKPKSDNGVGMYSTNGYSSSNIIRMLRVKQEVIADPRMGLSKEQLLTRLIKMEKEYNCLKGDNRNMHITGTFALEYLLSVSEYRIIVFREGYTHRVGNALSVTIGTQRRR